MRSAKVVIDAGFGDGGKGLVVDNLCESNNPLVVRFSGGQQCGHTVITPEGVKHTFSSYGSGSLRGCQTFCTEDTTMYLPALINEYNILSEKCKPDMVIHPLAMLTTPYDVAYNRAKEECLVKHGSCGLGVGATMKRCIETPYKTFVQDLVYPEMLLEKMNSVREYYKRLILDHEEFRYAFDCHVGQLFPAFIESLKQWHRKIHFKIGLCHDLPRRYVVFEGSQGIMLDMDHGVFPNVTYANTTSKNAWKYIRKWSLSPEIFYVTRCYTTRHGEGWMPDERPIELINTEEEINVTNRWQGGFRIGEFSYPMINQAIAFDSCYHNDYSPRKNFVLTCRDQRPDFRFTPEDVQGINKYWTNDSPRRGNLKLLDE